MDTRTAAPVTWLCAGAGFSHGRLLVDELYEAIISATPLASHPSGELWLYDGGVYRHAGRLLAHLVTTRQRGRFKPEDLRALVAYAEAALTNLLGPGDVACRVRPPRQRRNGMVNPFGRAGGPRPEVPLRRTVAGRLRRRGDVPDVRSLARRGPAVERRAGPTCWRTSACCSTCAATTRRGGFPIWLTRSGESTLARIVGGIVGIQNRSTEELDHLAGNNVAARKRFGKVLNVASDISTGHRHGHAQEVALSGLTDRRAQVRTHVQLQVPRADADDDERRAVGQRSGRRLPPACSWVPLHDVTGRP